MGWFSRNDNADFFLATIVPNGDAAHVQQYLGLVNGEAIIGANIFKDPMAGIRDIVGGRAGGYEEGLRRAREEALREMAMIARERFCADGLEVFERWRAEGFAAPA